MRRYGERRVPGQRYQIRPGVYTILPLGGQLLLTYQADPFYEVQLPGGGIDLNEAILPALHREVFEETGWRVANPRRLGVYRRFVFMPEYDLWAEKVCHIYRATPVRRLGPPSEEGHTALWMTPEEAVDAVEAVSDRAMLLRYMNGEFGPLNL